MAVVKNKRGPYQLLILGAWNVRTTNNSDGTIRLECATAIICKELEKAGIHICALSEVRRPQLGNIKEKSHTIFWSGGEYRMAGVGFAISNKYDQIIPVPVNDRLMRATVPLNNITYLTVIRRRASMNNWVNISQEQREKALSCWVISMLSGVEIGSLGHQ